MIQFLLHLLGDYITQSSWMAENKTKAWFPAFCHALIYSLPFLVIASPLAWLVIFGTHLLIDRFRLVRYVVFAKNFLAPQKYWPTWSDCESTGYHKDTPPFLAVWLMIIADNTCHLFINYFSLML
jgi:hypothetical protein